MAAVMERNERLCDPVSDAELARRWKAARAHMRANGIDALVMQNSNDYLGGYVRWFTGFPATHAYPRAVIFPAQGLMSVVEQGNFGSDTQLDGTGPQPNYGIGHRFGTPSFVSAGYTSGYDGEIVAREIKKAAYKTVGLVSPASMYHGFGLTVKEQAKGVKFTDATDAIDLLKAIKSAEEISFIRRVAAMQDEVVAKLREHIKPGMRDFEVAAYAQYIGQLLGSESGIYLAGSVPPGRPAGQQERWQMNRQLKKGDTYRQLVENNGASGYYCELGRMFVLGKATQEQKEAVAKAVEAQHETLKRLTPGTPCREIHAAHNAYMRGKGFPEDKRLYCHGQGYDLVERPLIRQDEPMSIEENMLIVCHPGLQIGTSAGGICDNYLVTKNGAEPLHKTPQTLIEID
jgi:Xaa-Pro aminopeptidase